MPRAQSDDAGREYLEKEEDRRLPPWAARSSEARRAAPLEREGRVFDYRTEFQRDRDRILHSRAFRRLRLKSHGGATPPNERYRDRLTHTLEVSQLSRTVARGLGLNEDLVEAIALGHEIGIPPFGRAGESALATLLAPSGATFRCDLQSLRVVDRIEKRYEHPGLNLTDATREGILKHAGWTPGSGPADPGLEEPALHVDWAPHLEAQAVGVIEEVASVVQDLDDGLRSGELEPGVVEELPIVRELMRRVGPRVGRAGARGRGTGRGALFMRANVINRGLTHMLVAGIIHHSRRALRSWGRSQGLSTREQFARARATLPAGTIGLSPAVRRLYDGLRVFVARSLHQGAWLSAAASRARHTLTGLFRALVGDPRLAEDYLLLRFKEETGAPFLRDVAPARIEAEIERRYLGSAAFARLVADHIAGMTDLFALAEHERLAGPQAKGGTG